MRYSIREYAAVLGVETTTITNWRTGLSSVTPRPATQAILDTTYQQRATPDDRARFEQIVAEGETAWRARHRSLSRPVSARDQANDGDAQSSADQGTSEELITVLTRVQKLTRSISPDVVQQLQTSTLLSIDEYETLDPAGLVPALRKQRDWLDELVDQCGVPEQRRQLFETASETSGLLGYIAVGTGNFSTARAYCLESFLLGSHAQNGNLMAWARGMQSFCEYYAGQFDQALAYAEDGLAYAAAGPQSVRLTINGVARAKGKLGDVEGVHRAVDEAYTMTARAGAPTGVPSSISLESYSAAQVAGNAATAYLSLGMPDRVETYVQQALPEMNESNSPWGRSLVLIDWARSHVVSAAGDFDAAAHIMLDALGPPRGTLMTQVRRRGSEFVRDAAARWGTTAQLQAIQDRLANVNADDTHG
ncbi:hypothetical protein [Nocardia brasiliensis]|uniref:hypothetical protein n=1 Tax=Nocardia brasiliensis TaxID=37326 RepID=UPI002454AD07|nr:hypothetical protein [Nocardia brasiliensis]